MSFDILLMDKNDTAFDIILMGTLVRHDLSHFINGTIERHDF